jgi:hypothetical protein
MEPWYNVATPRKEVREGRSFNPDEFAIHLEQVIANTAPEDYREPDKFFARTCFTRALREHAGMVLRRLSGETANTAPVMTLITQFGGGKTHTLTAGDSRFATHFTPPHCQYSSGSGRLFRNISKPAGPSLCLHSGFHGLTAPALPMHAANRSSHWDPPPWKSLSSGVLCLDNLGNPACWPPLTRISQALKRMPERLIPTQRVH